MKKTISRRELLGLGAAAGAAILGSCSGNSSPIATNAPPSQEGISPAPFPWPYKKLDVEKTKARAYENYFKAGCMYGVFEAIAGQTAEMLGNPYTDFPFMLSSYGGGGIAMWGTLCGTCNGAAMAVAMFQMGKQRNAVINEIFTWYENSPLPTFVPEKPKKVANNKDIKTSQAKSTLCHISITRWTNASGFESFSPQRVERCARLVADMAGFTASLLNKSALKQFVPNQQISENAKGCLECHAKGNQAPNEPEVVSKMQCSTCHDDPHNK